MSKPTSPQNEREFLISKAKQAKLAMKDAAQELQQNLGKQLPLQDWIKKHPWPSLGIGALAGFAASYLMIPDKNDKALHKLDRNPSMENHEALEPEAKAHSLKAVIASGLSTLALDFSREFLHQWMHKSQTKPAFEEDNEIADVPSPS